MQISEYDKRNSTRNLASPYTLAGNDLSGHWIYMKAQSFRLPGSTILVIFFFFFFTNLSFQFHQLIFKK